MTQTSLRTAAPAPAPAPATEAPPAVGIHPDRSRSWLRRAAPLLLRHRRLLASALFSALVSTVLVMRVPYVLDDAVTRALVARDTPLAPFVQELLLLSLGTGVTSYVARRQLMQASFAIEADLRTLLYEQLTRMSAAFYDRHQSGELLSRASSDVRAVQLYLSFCPLMVVQCLVALLAFGFMLAIEVLLACVVLATLPLAVLLTMRMRRSLVPTSWLVQARLGDVATRVDENVQGVQVVRAYAAEDREVRDLADASQRLAWAYVRDADVRSRLAPVLQNLSQLGMVLVLLVGGHQVIEGRLDVGAVLAFSFYVLLLQGPYQVLAEMVMLGQRAAAAARRVYEVLDEEPSVVDTCAARGLIVQSGEVVFDDVSFAYVPGRPVLTGFTLHLRRGETVALVGRSGSGKSTVARLLTRSYDVDAGSVSVDGTDLRAATLASVRAAVGVVPEEPFLFSTTIRENIAYGLPGASIEQVRRAARAAHADAFVAALPDGYDTMVGERGLTLSGGQRQRLALARTLLADPPVLVLDDALSALDAEVEAAVHQALGDLLGARTVLVVAHRLSTVLRADRVVLVDGGRVVADGTHGDLVENSPLYRDLLASRDVMDAVEETLPGGET